MSKINNKGKRTIGKENKVIQKIRVLDVFLESLLSESFPALGVRVHLISLGCPLTLLISEPAVGLAQILIWSCSCVLLPPMSTAIRTSAFSLAGALCGLLYLPQTQSLPG